jgi:hypothetical protein
MDREIDEKLRDQELLEGQKSDKLRDDTEGHKLRGGDEDEDDTEGHKWRGEDDDDVEGHKLR